MTDTMAAVRPSRTWLKVATIGCAMVVFAMIVVALVILDKEDFGWLVGSMFLPVIASGVIVGGLVVVVGAWNLPQRKSWRGITLLLWGFIAVTSPAFGLMFLLPWGALVVMLPVVIVALSTLFKEPVAGVP